MSSFFAGPIEKRVMEVVRTKIAAAEKAHEEQCKDIDVQCDTEIERIEGRRESDKTKAADKFVNDLLGKFL